MSMATEERKDAAAGGEDGRSTSTHFLFENKVFSLPGGFFSHGRDNEAVYNVHLGDVWGQLPFRTLRESFQIPENSADSRLLQQVEKGLKYVREIRPGDSIPRELLDGSASWRVEPRHLAVARGRLTLQLVSWMTGSEMTVTDRFQLEQIVDDPQTKSRAQEAFGRLAKQFGLPEDRRQEVIDKVESLARELSYIEALRDRYAQVQKIMGKLVQAKRVFKGDHGMLSELARMQALSKTPIANFDDIFEQCDGQTSEVMAMLRSYDATVAFVRRMRDEAHTDLMVWDEMIDLWEGIDVDKSVETESALKRTYQFLAQHFLIAKVWSRSSS